MDKTAKALDGQTGERLREFRESVGLSQAQLAERVGHDVESIRLNEAGERCPSAVELWELCSALGTKPHDFFGA